MVSIPRVGPGAEFAPIPVRRSENVFVLTGAGISAESGVRTFRDADGLWEEHHIEDVATPAGFQRDPALVWRFYSERRRQALEVQPNPAHRALAQLEQHLGDAFFLCTQNVDPLHERAGSQRVLHMHGELLRTSCSRPGCAQTTPFEDSALYLDPAALPRCPCGALWRPHVVWFGEVPLGMRLIGDALAEADIFITIGSSGAVYPAAGLVSHLRNVPNARTGKHAKTIYIGLERPENAHCFDECRLGKAGELLPAMFELVE
jgi:NAD-dependent deacetylase